MDCTFCKITSGVIPAKLVAESEHCLAFNDIAPRQPVHILVIPKEHYRDVTELTEQNPVALADLMSLATKIAKEHTHGSYRLTFNTGAGAGQTVFHAHAHVTSTAG